MIHQRIELNEQGSKNAFVTTYIMEANPELPVKKRPTIVICPGGGYEFVSYRESEPVALQYLARGYNVVVLRYSIYPDATYPTALLELGRVVQMLRERADEWLIDENKIVLMGFSAGGHLAASYSCFWTKAFLSDTLGCDKDMLKPNGVILSYPVITSGEYAHRGSFVSLLGDRYDELVEEMSLENQVTGSNPPTFLWHTVTDVDVPVENSLLFTRALKDKNILVELHLYSEGPHGLALANEFTAVNETQIVPSCQTWVELAHLWMTKIFAK